MKYTFVRVFLEVSKLHAFCQMSPVSHGRIERLTPHSVLFCSQYEERNVKHIVEVCCLIKHFDSERCNLWKTSIYGENLFEPLLRACYLDYKPFMLIQAPHTSVEHEGFHYFVRQDSVCKYKKTSFTMLLVFFFVARLKI